jgi:hypothetical protein
MFFKRKEKVKALCFHEWKVVDVGLFTNDVTAYTIGCEKCDSSRWVGPYEYSQMKANGLIKEESQ